MTEEIGWALVALLAGLVLGRAWGGWQTNWYWRSKAPDASGFRTAMVSGGKFYYVVTDQEYLDKFLGIEGKRLIARISGAWLRREGNHAVMALEIDGQWVDVSRELAEGHFSHIVEVGGIEARVRKAKGLPDESAVAGAA